MPSSAELLLETVRKTLDRHAMIPPHANVLAAVSGGPDSMCLLHVLLDLGFRPGVAHLDHLTREGASTADATFVRETAKRLQLPFVLEQRAVEAEARAAGRSFEEHARRIRYEFLLRTARCGGYAVLATGHHADDQAETVLMRTIRGTTPRGLAGIPPMRDAPGVRIVRPLIACGREQILAYLDERDIPHRHDATNVDLQHLRNRIRHELLPQLRRDYNPRMREALLRLSAAQRSDEELLAALAEEFERECVREDGTVDRAAFAEGPRPLQRRLMLSFAWRYGVDCPFERVDDAVRFALRAAPGRAFDLGGGLLLRIGQRTLEFLSMAKDGDDTPIALGVPGETLAFGRRFVVRLLEYAPSEDLRSYCTPVRQVFDARALEGGLAVRRRRPGDRFRPLGLDGTKKLKDYFNDLGLSMSQRREQLLVVSGGRIVWIVGHGIHACAAVTDDTRRWLEIQVEGVAPDGVEESGDASE